MRIVVIGAGLSGLVAARTLAQRHEVVVIDKSAEVGGRLSTVDLGTGRCDAGAQFFTVRGADLQTQTDEWVRRGVARVWCDGFTDRADGYPRYVGTSGMQHLARDLADGLDIRTDTMAFTVKDSQAGWRIVIDDGTHLEADAVVMTCPTPQAWSLLVQSTVQLPDERLLGDYHRTIALLLALDRPVDVPAPGAVQFDPADDANPFGFVADNLAKGISPTPTLTLHATQPWSLAHWDDSSDSIEAALTSRAAEWIAGARVTHAAVRRWRFAGPVNPQADPFHLDTTNRLLYTGDRFGGAKFEGAFRSGLEGARALLDVL